MGELAGRAAVTALAALAACGAQRAVSSPPDDSGSGGSDTETRYVGASGIDASDATTAMDDGGGCVSSRR
jgi:hypothetical protein